MSILTEVRFAHERGALADTFAAHPELDAAIVGDARTEPGRSVYPIEFRTDSPGSVLDTLREDSSVRSVRRMPEFGDDGILGIEFREDAKLLNPAVTSADGFVLEARSANTGSPRGWHERWLLPDDEALRTVWQHAREEGFDFEVLELHRGVRGAGDLPGVDALTDEQREALVTAHEHGYFAEPRETSLEELAEELGISPTAVGGRLRRGMKSLIGRILVVDRTERPER